MAEISTCVCGSSDLGFSIARRFKYKCCGCGRAGTWEDSRTKATAAFFSDQRVLKNGPAAEEALRIIARNLKAGAVSTQWVNKYANDAVEALNPEEARVT